MKLLTEFPNVSTFIEADVLRGHSETRMLIFSGGTEQFTINNVSSYDKNAGRVNFTNDLGGVPARVFICS